jgi:superfamily II DNA or RNA helicase
MTEYQFDSSNFVSSEPATISSLPYSDSHKSVQSRESGSSEKENGNIASFICHVAYLEKNLRDDGTSIFLNEKIEADTLSTKLGEGSQFSVFRAESKYKKNWKTFQAQRWGEYIAIKTVKPKAKSTFVILPQSRIRKLTCA